jgi:hypothetical protein
MPSSWNVFAPTNNATDCAGSKRTRASVLVDSAGCIDRVPRSCGMAVVVAMTITASEIDVNLFIERAQSQLGTPHAR